MQPFAISTENLRARDACRLQSLGRPFAFSAAGTAEFQALIPRYPTKQALVLPALWIAQRELGWISTEVIEYVAGLCEMAPSHVYGVVSFYTMYNRAPVGKYLLQVCTNLSCQLMGAEQILEAVEKRLGLHLGETTEDGVFTLIEVECLAACELAPLIQVNEEFVGPLTEESAVALVNKLRNEAKN